MHCWQRRRRGAPRRRRRPQVALGPAAAGRAAGAAGRCHPPGVRGRRAPRQRLGDEAELRDNVRIPASAGEAAGWAALGVPLRRSAELLRAPWPGREVPVQRARLLQDMADLRRRACGPGLLRVRPGLGGPGVPHAAEVPGGRVLALAVRWLCGAGSLLPRRVLQWPRQARHPRGPWPVVGPGRRPPRLRAGLRVQWFPARR
mmetsp:Transcript_12381/g.32847  ORF Transcript_12381/g.32847 Transcript_12381/m.32847 type:complete len:202 (-) Transcript_12381:659-1264(-)